MIDAPEALAIVQMEPDQGQAPTLWQSTDLGNPNVVFRRAPDGSWQATLERRMVMTAPDVRSLAAGLYREHGLVALMEPAAGAA